MRLSPRGISSSSAGPVDGAAPSGPLAPLGRVVADAIGGERAVMTPRFGWLIVWQGLLLAG